MNLNLKNKNFIISGSSRGIGFKIAENLLNEGARVIITGRSKSLIRKRFKKLSLKFNPRVLFVHGDIKDQVVLKKIDKLDI